MGHKAAPVSIRSPPHFGHLRVNGIAADYSTGIGEKQLPKVVEND
jgi:hypothetical protein